MDPRAVLAGALVGGGLFAGMLALFGSPPPLSALVPRFLRGLSIDRVTLRLALAVGALTAVWATTSWPAAGLVAGVYGAAAPSLVGGRARREAAVARIEAIAAWAEQLRDTLVAAKGIESAIEATAPLAPVAIRPQVKALAARLAAGAPLTPALYEFGAAVDHSLADMIVACLVVATEERGRNLAGQLSEVASDARQMASMRLRIETTRVEAYGTARLIAGLTAAFAVWLSATRRDYLEPFDSPAGQVMVVVIGVIFAVSGVLLARMSRPHEPPRLLARAEGDQ